MNKVAKKVIIYSMVGIMQIGFGASVLEASPRHDDGDRWHRYEERQHDRDRKIREENERHEREMQRRHNEEEREWRERQDREKEHHEEIMRTLGGLALLAVILHNN